MNRIHSCTSQIQRETPNSTLCSNVAILPVGGGVGKTLTYKRLVLIPDFFIWLADRIGLKEK